MAFIYGCAPMSVQCLWKTEDSITSSVTGVRNHSEGWRDGWAVKITGYSSRVLRINSQHPQMSVTPVPVNLKSSHRVYTGKEPVNLK